MKKPVKKVKKKKSKYDEVFKTNLTFEQVAELAATPIKKASVKKN